MRRSMRSRTRLTACVGAWAAVGSAIPSRRETSVPCALTRIVIQAFCASWRARQTRWALDASLAWPGYYFVLSGRLSPVNGVGPADIGMPLLLKRVGAGVEEGVLREVVVAMSYTPEGDATAYYLIDVLKKRWPQLRVTRLARGLPAGIEIEYTDLSTIANAVYARRDALRRTARPGGRTFRSRPLAAK